MLKFSFVLAVLLVAKGLVAQPINARGSSIIVARDVSSNPPPSLTENLFKVVVNSLGGNPQSSGSSHPVVPAPPSPSPAGDQSQDELKRRMMNDEYRELLTRAIYEGRLDARTFDDSPGPILQRRRRRKKNRESTESETQPNLADAHQDTAVHAHPDETQPNPADAHQDTAVHAHPDETHPDPAGHETHTDATPGASHGSKIMQLLNHPQAAGHLMKLLNHPMLKKFTG